jgi:hypothetical protein
MHVGSRAVSRDKGGGCVIGRHLGMPRHCACKSGTAPDQQDQPRSFGDERCGLYNGQAVSRPISVYNKGPV